MAWYVKNSGGKTHPVGQKKPNAWGLYDMHGSVWEWCWDWYGNTLPGGTDPVGPASRSGRVFRGGGWGNDAYGCRAANRYYDTPDGRGYSVGFRSVLPLGQ
jgi:formylglycine-generating enzyme required for sulfatase activity